MNGEFVEASRFWEDNEKRINFIRQIYYHISTIELYFNNSQRNIFTCYIIKYH